MVEAGARALVVTGPGVGPVRRFDPAAVHVTPFEPFSAVAPRCRAAVHHGGIGTTISVMRAGLPHVAVPKGFDQPVSGGLIERLGLGVSVPWRQRRARLRRAVDLVLGDEALRSRAAAFAHELGPDGGAPSAAAVERFLPA